MTRPDHPLHAVLDIRDKEEAAAAAAKAEKQRREQDAHEQASARWQLAKPVMLDRGDKRRPCRSWAHGALRALRKTKQHYLHRRRANPFGRSWQGPVGHHRALSQFERVHISVFVSV